MGSSWALEGILTRLIFIIALSLNIKGVTSIFTPLLQAAGAPGGGDLGEGQFFILDLNDYLTRPWAIGPAN